MQATLRPNVRWDSYMGRYHELEDPMPELMAKRASENPQECIEQLIEMWSERTFNHSAKVNYRRLLFALHIEEVSDCNSINNKLNDDCLEAIFVHLSHKDKLAFERVCKRWREVAILGWQQVKDLDVYEKIDEDGPEQDKRKNSQVIGGILRRCGEHLHRLRIGDPCDYNIMTAVEQYCQNLTTLKILFAKFSTQDARRFPRMQNLKYLEIRGLKHYPKKLFDALPVDNLTELHLWAIGYGSLPLIAPTILEKCTNLTALSLNGFAPDPNVLNVISKKSGLESLSLSNCLLNVGLPSLEGLTNLERLDLSWVGGVVEWYIEKLANCCKKLKYLDLTHCTFVDDEAIAHLSKLPKLERLMAKRIPDITDAPLSNLRNLKELQCGYNSRISNAGIIALLANAPHLQYLNLRGTSVTKEVLTEARKIAEERTDNLPLCVVISKSVGVLHEVFACLVAGVDHLVFETQFTEKCEIDRRSSAVRVSREN